MRQVDILVKTIYSIVNKVYIAPNTAPNDFTSTTATPTSITFQWIPITDQDANGIVRWYIITCNDTITVNNYAYLFSQYILRNFNVPKISP